MSDTRINIRILFWHIQVTHGWKVRLSYNSYHRDLHDGLFAVYQFEPFKNFK